MPKAPRVSVLLRSHGVNAFSFSATLSPEVSLAVQEALARAALAAGKPYIKPWEKKAGGFRHVEARLNLLEVIAVFSAIHQAPEIIELTRLQVLRDEQNRRDMEAFKAIRPPAALAAKVRSTT